MPGSDRLLAAFDKQLTELIERWKRQKKKKRKKVEWGGEELSCVLLCCCQDFIWWSLILMHVCVNVVTCTFVYQCAHAHVCVVGFFHMLLCVCMSSGHAFWKGMELWWCFFCVFPSTYLLSLIIHDMRQRNELGGLGCRDELQQNQCLDIE